jgi:hypothetical protein
MSNKNNNLKEIEMLEDDLKYIQTPQLRGFIYERLQKVRNEVNDNV